MAYNENTAQRIRDFFILNKIQFTEKKMFSGICFMLNDKMCCGTHIDKATEQDYLLCRIGEDNYKDALKKEHVIPMEFTGKAMKGYVFVTEKGHSREKDLGYWLQQCVSYNPLAKSSKKK